MDMTSLFLLVLFGFLAVPGLQKIAEEFYELFLVGRGYLKVFLFYPNRRFSYWYAKPKGNEVFVKGGRYEFSDDPDYMPTLSGLFTSMPSIFLDWKTKKQIKVCRTEEVGHGEKDPRAADGAGKMAWSAGFIEGAGDMKNIKLFFMIIMIAVIGIAVLEVAIKSGMMPGA